MKTTPLGILLALTVYFSSVDCKLITPLGDNLGEQGRIVGGVTAAEGEAPFQVSLQHEWGHFCGGAIIHHQWIATAAHCVAAKDKNNIWAVTGTQDLSRSGVNYYIKRVYTHCNYNRPSNHNDIALLHLNSSIVLNEKTQIVPLPRRPMADGDDVMLTGWGSEEAWGDSPDKLKKVNLKYVEHQRCKALLSDNPGLDVGHICTFTKYGEGSCHGDSGGSLVSNGTLVGLVNWGYPCAVGYPDMHASPLYYLNWIRQIMSGNTKCLGKL